MINYIFLNKRISIKIIDSLLLQHSFSLIHLLTFYSYHFTPMGQENSQLFPHARDDDIWDQHDFNRTHALSFGKYPTDEPSKILRDHGKHPTN